MLVDTDVLIWYLKGNENAYQAISLFLLLLIWNLSKE